VVQKSSQNGKPRRGRPRAYDPDAALRAARDVFWVKGYAATSLDDIAQATGMNRPSLYAAFGDKDAIYLAALQLQADGMVKAVMAAVDLDLPLRSFLQLFFSRTIDSYLAGEHGARGCFLIGTALTEFINRDKVAVLVREAFLRVETLLEQRLKSARTKGELPKSADPKAFAHLISATMHELSMLARSGESKARLLERANLAIKLIGA
jgi:TetR/AcrR family transcriptional regulator, copper-responsive repressor